MTYACRLWDQQYDAIIHGSWRLADRSAWWRAGVLSSINVEHGQRRHCAGKRASLDERKSGDKRWHVSRLELRARLDAEHGKVRHTAGQEDEWLSGPHSGVHVIDDDVEQP